MIGEPGSHGWRRSGLLKALGPGFMYAGAAIGVSHLVQSATAGAKYGFALVWAVVVVHLLKYPFFEYAHRYAAATGESLLVGYQRVGRWALISFLLIAFGLSIPTAAVLTIVTAVAARGEPGRPGYVSSPGGRLRGHFLLGTRSDRGNTRSQRSVRAPTE